MDSVLQLLKRGHPGDPVQEIGHRPLVRGPQGRSGCPWQCGKAKGDRMIAYYDPQTNVLRIASTYRTLCCSRNIVLDTITKLYYYFWYEAMGQQTDKSFQGKARVDSDPIWRVGWRHGYLRYALREGQKDAEQDPEASSGLPRRKTQRKEVKGRSLTRNAVLITAYQTEKA